MKPFSTTVSILDLMDCRVKTLLIRVTLSDIFVVSILDLMDCRVKTGVKYVQDDDVRGFNP